MGLNYVKHHYAKILNFHWNDLTCNISITSLHQLNTIKIKNYFVLCQNVKKKKKPSQWSEIFCLFLANFATKLQKLRKIYGKHHIVIQHNVKVVPFGPNIFYTLDALYKRYLNYLKMHLFQQSLKENILRFLFADFQYSYHMCRGHNDNIYIYIYIYIYQFTFGLSLT